MSRTASGRPLLSNDPHLATSIPSVFAQVGLHCRTVSDACPYDVAGFSLASVPGVVIGHNASIAWGLTTSYWTCRTSISRRSTATRSGRATRSSR